jgi:beta-glucanase (GH16 family)
MFTAIWLLPRFNYYGSWPSSGEIDLTEGRGNRKLTSNNQNIGSELTSSTLHFGPFWPLNGYEHAHFEKNTAPDNGFDKDFNLFQLEWTPGKDGFIYVAHSHCSSIFRRNITLF